MQRVVVTEHGGPEVFEVQEYTPEPLSDDEVRIDVRGAGVNFADVEQRRGRYRYGPVPPFVPGLEAAGVVTGTGSAVEAWSPGDEVVCFLPDGGGYATTAVAAAAHVLPKPDTLSFPEAGGMLVQTFTAHNALHEWGGMSGGDTVLVTAAAGGVGSVAVQLAATGGGTVLGVASTGAKRSYARECGADHTLDYADLNDIDSHAGVDGVDLLLDGVGGSAFADGLEALVPGGTAVTYGVASGDVATVATPRLLYGNTAVVGYHLLGGLRDLPERVFTARQPVYEAVESGALSVTVEDTRPLAAAPAVHRAVEARETRGRVVLVP